MSIQESAADGALSVQGSVGGDGTAADRLASAVMSVYQAFKSEIAKVKTEAEKHWEKQDFIWDGLLRSAATMGNSRGIQLLEKMAFYDPVRFDNLKALSANERLAILEDSLRKASVRWPAQKASRLARNFQRILDRGGPEIVKGQINNIQGREKKINFLQEFDGVGPKYARNLMMDTHHEDFRETIAVDSRIREILREIGFPTNATYDTEETFLLSVAKKVGIEGWELDRLLYLYKPQVVAKLKRSSTCQL